MLRVKIYHFKAYLLNNVIPLYQLRKVVLTKLEFKKPFRLYNSWLQLEAHKDLVIRAWSVRQEGTPIYIITRKLKLVKAKTKE